ncbi:hypothetical protein SAMN04490202_0999 [Pseudomonas reinekei]|uniref:Glucosyl transferase GtrII n=2 Tax=Pseudomonas reinekei TaxID=395598 RepID=A0A1H0JU43_PSERE|nr:hypothetical protein SAMN04490202_0999 [Pseudomonas reinekei]
MVIKMMKSRRHNFYIGSPYVKYIILIFVVFSYLSYVIPLVHSYYNSTNFIYVNAWDEETYLSYQGALGAMKVPGYWFSSSLVYVLQNFGFSGANINLIFDCFLMPILFFGLVYTIVRFDIGFYRALFFSVLIVFSPILFNFGNPLINAIFKREYGLFGFGFEPYQSILRTPEPQMSFILVVLASAFYARTKKISGLLVVLPFLYFYVAVVYVYTLIAAYFIRLPGFYKGGHKLTRIVLACLASYFLISIGFSILDFIFFSKDLFIVGFANMYVRTHLPIVPIAGVFGASLLVIQLFLSKRIPRIQSGANEFQLFLVLSIFFVSNIHVFSGVMLSYKNYMDYGVGFLGGVSLIVFLQFLLVNRVFGGVLVSTLFGCLILCLTLNAYGFSFKDGEYNFFRGLQFKTAEEYRHASQNPMSVIVTDSDLSAKLPYSVAKAGIPLFSYQYNFPVVARGCESILVKMQEAIDFLQINRPDVYKSKRDYFMRSIEVFSGRNIVALNSQSNTEESIFCKSLNSKKPFEVLESDFRDDGWQRIKIW